MGGAIYRSDMSSANAMPEAQLRRRANLAFPIFLFSLGLIVFYGADNLFGAVLFRKFYDPYPMLALSAAYLALFLWYIKPSVWGCWVLFWVTFAAFISGLTYYLFIVPFIAMVFVWITPVALVLSIIVLIAFSHWYTSRNQPVGAKLRGRRKQMAIFCLFMNFYIQGLTLRDDNDAAFVTSEQAAGRIYHFAVIPQAMDGPSLTLYECNSYSVACREVYSEETRYDDEASFSLTIDAGSIVILANGDPVYRHPLP
jgi:hypothetical protein